jgi:ribonuclease R
VRLKETGADGLLPIARWVRNSSSMTRRRHALVGDRSGTLYRLGDIVRVRLAEAAPLTGGLRFDLAERTSSRHANLGKVREPPSPPKGEGSG